MRLSPDTLWHRAWRAAHPEENRKRNRRHQAAWRARHPQEALASSRFNHAKRRLLKREAA